MEVSLAKKVTLTEKILLGRNGKGLHYIVKKAECFLYSLRMSASWKGMNPPSFTR